MATALKSSEVRMMAEKMNFDVRINRTAVTA